MKVRDLPAPLRWPPAIVLLIAAAWFFGSLTRMKNDDVPGALVKCLFAFPALIAGTVLIGPELAAWAAAPLNHLLGNIYFPNGSETPPVDYRLARRYRAEGRYEEAIEQYFHILDYHPQELFAYLEGMETAFEGSMPRVARDLCRKGLRSLSSTEARGQLQRIFDLNFGGRQDEQDLQD